MRIPLTRLDACYRATGAELFHLKLIPRADGAAYGVENPGYATSLIPRADGAAYGLENPGYATPHIPRADGAAYGVENPGYADLRDDGLAVLLLDHKRNHQ